MIKSLCATNLLERAGAPQSTVQARHLPITRTTYRAFLLQQKQSCTTSCSATITCRHVCFLQYPIFVLGFPLGLLLSNACIFQDFLLVGEMFVKRIPDLDLLTFFSFFFLSFFFFLCDFSFESCLPMSLLHNLLFQHPPVVFVTTRYFGLTSSKVHYYNKTHNSHKFKWFSQQQRNNITTTNLA